jgi:hypothetical protein
MLTPYIEANDGDMLGYVRYEEDRLPTVMVWNCGEIALNAQVNKNERG